MCWQDEFDFDIDEYIDRRRARFKGGGGGSYEVTKPSLTEKGQWSEEKMYGTAERAMAGGGLLPANIRARDYGRLRGAAGEAWQFGKQQLSSYLNRTVSSSDTKVRNYAENMLDRMYYGNLNQLSQEYRTQPYQDRQMGMSMATDYLSQARRMGISIANEEWQGQQGLQAGQERYGTLGSNLARGLGEMGGYLYASQWR
jgi:hypothetical protein